MKDYRDLAARIVNKNDPYFEEVASLIKEWLLDCLEPMPVLSNLDRKIYSEKECLWFESEWNTKMKIKQKMGLAEIENAILKN